MESKWPEVKIPAEWEKKDIYKPVFLNKYGYYELRKQNTPEERGKNFEENYFQNYAGQTYAKEYPENELAFIQNKIEERELVIRENLKKAGKNPEDGYSLLDIGCGEGFLLKHFHDKGAHVKGIDFGVYALEHFHPKDLLRDLLLFGSTASDKLTSLAEYVERMKEVMSEHSILVIKVANNYSNIQRMLLAAGEMKEEYWLDDPDHTGYFNREGLIALMEDHGMECLDFYGDTFVDLQLLNPYSNYYEKPETGHAAHQTAVRMENLLHEISPERTVEVYRLLGEMGFGREIVGVFRKKGK